MTTWSGGGAPAGAVGAGVTGGVGFTADPDGLRTAAGGFATVADAVTALAETLDAALSAEGQSWGSDEPGQTFAQDYVPAAQGAQQGLADLVTGLLDIQALLVRNADDLERADEANGSQYCGGVGGGIGGAPAEPTWPDDPSQNRPFPMPQPLPTWPGGGDAQPMPQPVPTWPEWPNGGGGQPMPQPLPTWPEWPDGGGAQPLPTWPTDQEPHVVPVSTSATTSATTQERRA